MALPQVLFKNKLLLLLRNEKASLFLYEDGKLILKGGDFDIKNKTEWGYILEQYKDYPIEILIDNELEFFQELPLFHLNFIDRFRCLYYKRKEFLALNNFVEYFLCKSKKYFFAIFLTYSKTHKLYPWIEWIDAQQNFFLGVRLFYLEIYSYFKKNPQVLSPKNKIFFIRETSGKLRQIVIAEDRILSARDIFVEGNKTSIGEKIKQEALTIYAYFSRQNILIEEVIVISDQKIVKLENIFKEGQSPFLLKEIILKVCYADITWFDNIIIGNIGHHPSRFIIKPYAFYRKLISCFLDKKFSWVCSILIIFLAGISIVLYQKKTHSTQLRYSLENEINILRKTIRKFEKESQKYDDFKEIRNSILIYEKINSKIKNPLIFISELKLLAKIFSITFDDFVWALSDQKNIEITFCIKFQGGDVSKESVLKKWSEIEKNLQSRYGKENVIILSSPYNIENHETYIENYNSSDHSDLRPSRVPHAMIKMRLPCPL